MQLLKGSDILKLNFKDPNDRSIFTSATKIVTIIVIVAETLLYGVSVYGGATPSGLHLAVLIAQLMAASIIVMYINNGSERMGSGRNQYIHHGWGRTSDIMESL